MSLIDPLVTTDQTDYAPGETATFTASGFGIGDDLQFTITVIDPTTGATLWSGPTWDVIDGGAGDLSSLGGTVQTQFQFTWAYAGATVQLSVTDLTNPTESATTTFTDSVVPEPDLAITYASTALDLSAPASNGQTQTTGAGAVWGAENSTIDTNTSTLVKGGTGVFNTFSRVEGSGNAATEQGYNSDGTLQYDEVASIHTHSIQLGTLEKVDATGSINANPNLNVYYDFLLDVNQPGSSPYISLDGLQIFTASSPTLHLFTASPNPDGGTAGSFTDPGNNAVLRYDLDGTNNGGGGPYTVYINSAFGSGSGQGNNNAADVVVLIPTADFATAHGSDYIYLYSAFGYQLSNGSGSWQASSGFEEWGAVATQVPGLSITKSVTGIVHSGNDPAGLPNGDADGAGDVIDYSITVSNTGSVNLTNVTITDPLTGFSIDVGTLAIGASTTVTDSYTVTQANMNNGGLITNVATATDDQGDNHSSTVSTPVDQDAALKVTKAYTTQPSDGTDPSGAAGVVDHASQVIDYTIVVTNTGNVTLTNVTVNDPLTGQSVDVGTLLVGQSATVTDAYNNSTLEQNHLDSNTAITNTVSATSDQGASATAAVTTPVDPDPSLTISKSVTNVTHAASDVTTTAGHVDGAGDVIDYTIVVTNTGNVDLTNVVVTDPLTGNAHTDSASLAPGATYSFTDSYTVTQSDMDNHSALTNVATATDNQGDNMSSHVSTPVDQDHALTIAKSVTTVVHAASDVTTTAGHVDGAGDVIDYTIVVTNTGNVDLTNVVVTDPLTGNAHTDSASLAPGATYSFTDSYTVTQSDMDSHSALTNVATATDNQGDNHSSTVSTPVDQDHALTIAKSVTTVVHAASDVTTTAGHVDGAGDVIDYTIVVTNTGNVDLTNVVVTDPLTGNAHTDSASLAPGATYSFTDSYTVTQSDMDSHSALTNVATATDNQGDNHSSTVSTPVDQDHALTIAKSVTTVVHAASDVITTPLHVDGAGDVIDYTIVVTNTGNVDLTNVVVTDPLTGNAHTDSASLAPGATYSFTDSYTVTQSDMDNHSALTNVATATDNQGDNHSSTVSTPVDQDHALTIAKSVTTVVHAASDVTTTAGHVDGAGDVIDYTIVVTNTGNVDLTNVVVTDPLTGNAHTDSASLAPGATYSFTDSYTVTQSDMDSHSALTNVATATDNQGDNHSSTVSTPVDQDHALTIAKSVTTVVHAASDVTTTAGHVDGAGDVIDYTIVVTNTGNVDLTNVVVTDPLTGNAHTDSASLAPGATYSFTDSYTVTQSDMDSHSALTNVATATDNQGDNHSSTVSTPVDQDHALTIAKSVTMVVHAASDVTTTAGHVDGAGDVIDYTIVVTNTGNVDLTNVVVTDPLTGNAHTDSASLAPGATYSFTDSYTVTQSDMDNHSALTNVATATDNQGDNMSSHVSTPVDQDHALTIAKSVTTVVHAASDVTTTAGHVDGAGDVIDYTIVVTNTGNVDLTNVVVTDPLTGNAHTDSASLAPGATYSFTDSYTVTQSDMDNHSALTNVATATDNQGDNMSSHVSTPVDQDHALTIAKSVTTVVHAASDVTTTAGHVDGAGDVIDYTIVVTNTGNVDLTNVVVTDPLTGNAHTDSASLAPGATYSFTDSYTVTQSDMDSHSALTNVATATDNQGDNHSSTVSTPVDQDHALTIAKSVTTVVHAASDVITTPLHVDGAGDVIDYTIVVTNTGNVDLTNVVVTDPLTGNAHTDSASLAPGATYSFTDSYTVTQSDMDSHSALTNVATATDNQGDNHSSTVSTPVDQDHALTIAKSVTTVVHAASDVTTTAGHVDGAGDVIDYTIVVTNTGNVDLTNVVVTDPLTGNAHTDSASLAPGATYSFTDSYTVTQSDMDNNTALTNVATATDNQGDNMSSHVSTPVDQDPNWSIYKTVTVDNASDPADRTAGTIFESESNAAGQSATLTGQNVVDHSGQVLHYTLSLANDGNMTIGDITMTDSLIDTALGITHLPEPGDSGGTVVISNATELVQTFDSGAITLTDAANAGFGGTLGDNILDPSETWTWTYNYTATQSDINNNGNGGTGVIENQATAHSTDPNVDTILPNNPNTAITTVQVDQDPNWSIYKTVTVDNASDPADRTAGTIFESESNAAGQSATLTGQNVVDHSGQVLHYTLSLANDGNMTIGGITMTDSLIDAALGITHLPEPGDSGTVVISNATELVQTFDNGAITLTDAASAGFSGTLGDNILDPDETWTWTYNYTATQSDINNNGNGGTAVIENQATATSTDPNVDTILPNNPNTAITTVQVDQDPAVNIEKLVSNDGVTWYLLPDDPAITNPGGSESAAEIGYVAAALHLTVGVTLLTTTPTFSSGDHIEYAAVVTNTGNETLTNVTVSDVTILNTGLDKDLGTLAPGQSVVDGPTLPMPVQNGGYTNVVSVTDDQHATDTDAVTYDVFAPGPSLPGLTKGFWHQWTQVWDYTTADDGKYLHNLVPNVIAPIAGGTGHDLNPNNGHLVLGDVNWDGLANDAGGDLIIPLLAAQQILTDAPKGDFRMILASQALAAQLNSYNDYVYDVSKSQTPGTTASPDGLLQDAVKWLTTSTDPLTSHALTGGNVDTNGNGTLDASEYSTSTGKFTSSVPSADAWNVYVTVLAGPWHDSVNNTDHANGVAANGSGLASALESYNNDGNGLMVTVDGQFVGWGSNGGATITDIHPNTAGEFWGILADHNVGGVHFV